MASQSKIVAELIGTSGQIAADKLAPGAGGTNWTESVVTSSTLSAAINTGYYLNTTNNSIFVDLPSTSSPGGVISLVDVAATANSNRITIRPANGNKINGEFYDMDIDVQRGGAQLTYSGADFGWIATEAVNGLEGTNRTGKILVESNPVIESITNNAPGGGQYFQVDGDTIIITGRNFKRTSATGSVANLTVTYTDLNGTTFVDTITNDANITEDGTQITSTIPAGMAPTVQDPGGDPFDIVVTNPTSSDNLTIPLASNQLTDHLEWLPAPTFNVTNSDLGYLYYDDVNLTRLAATTLNATSLDSDDTITYQITSGALPSGMSFDENTGTISGIPDVIVYDAAGSTTHTFTVTATAQSSEGTNTETVSNSKQYTFDTRGTKVISVSPTDFNGAAGATLTLTGRGFSGTGDSAVSTVKFIYSNSNPQRADETLVKDTDFTVDSDTGITITTPSNITVADAGAGVDIQVVLVDGYTYKLSENTVFTLLTTGSNPVAGSPYTLTNILSGRGSYSATLPTPTDADGNTTFTFTLGTVTQTVNSVTTDLSANANTFSFTLNSTTGALTATVPTNYETSGGTITLPVTIEDNAGNTSSQNYTITVDSTGIYTTEITNSLMFDGSSYLSRQWNQAYTSQTMTYSFWIKFSDLSTTNTVLWAGISPQDSSNDDAFDFYLNSARIYTNSGFSIGSSTAKFRDTNSWYHFVMTADSTNGMRVYVNGGTSPILTVALGFANINFTNNGSYAQIGAQAQIASLRGYLANIYLIDGQALTPSSFGEYATLGTDTYWIPKEYDYLPQGTPSQRYGNNGFHLTFAPNTISGTGPTYTIADVSGNGNDWTANGF